MEKDTILVPYDFTEIAEYAVKHAIKISTHLKNRIQLIHIVKSDNQIEEATTRLNKEIERLKKEYQIDLDPVVEASPIW